MNVTQNIQNFNFTIQKLMNVKLFECEKDEFYNIGSDKYEKNDGSTCLDNEIWDGLKEICIKKEEYGKNER